MSYINITENEFLSFVKFMQEQYGINLTQKKNLIAGRLQNYLRMNSFDSFSELYDKVVQDKSGEMVTLLLNKLTTNHTYFLREIEHYNYFKDIVLPYIVKSDTMQKFDARIWSAGCSSGEEAYCIAMYLADYFKHHREKWDKKILATDISEKVLSTAFEGKYLSEHLDVLPKEWRANYFKTVDDAYSQVKEQIRQEVIFRKFNLMEEKFPFKNKFHIIWCRNVMIYFDTPTKIKLINKFYEHTEPGGFLFIGHSESIQKGETKYRYVMPAIYRKEMN